MLKVEGFVSDGATRRALQMVGNEAEVGITILNFASDGRPVVLGIMERLEFVDAPERVEDLKPYQIRGDAMAGNHPDCHGPADEDRRGSQAHC